MSSVIKRLTAGIVMAAVVTGATMGVAVSREIHYKPLESDQPVVMTINGDEVRADEYANYMLYNMKYYENMYAQIGMVGLWETEEAASMIGPSMSEAAKEQAIYVRVLLQNFEAEGLKMDGVHQRYMQNMKEEMLQQAAELEAQVQNVDVSQIDRQQAYEDMISDFGFTSQLYDNFMYANECYLMLEEKLFGEGGSQAPQEEELKQYFRDNYIAAKHILIMSGDMSGESRTDEEVKAAAEEALARIKAGEDFDTVMQELSEDPGLASNPDGYIFTEGEMMDEFYNAAKILEENEVSEPVKTDVGYHIIKRVPLDVDGQLENYRSQISEKLGKTMDSLLNQWMESAEVQTTDLFDYITYENVRDYALVSDQTEFNTVIGDAQGADTSSDNADTSENSAE